MCGYDPFYWYERELDREYEEEQCRSAKTPANAEERKLENDKERIN